MEPLLKGSNYWFFVPEDNTRETVEKVGGARRALDATPPLARPDRSLLTLRRRVAQFGDWVKANKKDANDILGGVKDGQMMDKAALVQFSKLPNRKELYTMIARAVKAVPTKVGRATKMAGGQKLARGFGEWEKKLKEEGEGSDE